MDTSAYIFIEVTQGKSREVSNAIAQVDGVASSHIVTGPYDIIVFASAQDIQFSGAGSSRAFRQYREW